MDKDVIEVIELTNRIDKIKYKTKINANEKSIKIFFEDFETLKEIIEKLI